jgi:hypothetical protein
MRSEIIDEPAWSMTAPAFLSYRANTNSIDAVEVFLSSGL